MQWEEVTKQNKLKKSMPRWDQVCDAMGRNKFVILLGVVS